MRKVYKRTASYTACSFLFFNAFPVRSESNRPSFAEAIFHFANKPGDLRKNSPVFPVIVMIFGISKTERQIAKTESNKEHQVPQTRPLILFRTSCQCATEQIFAE